MVKRLTMSSHPLDGAAMDAHPHGDYVLYSDFAELEAKNERLRTLVMAQSRAIHSPEALSRTGAVKVKALEWWVSDSGDIIADSLVGRYRLGRVSANINFRLETPSGLVEKPAPDYYWPEVEAKAAAQADYERRILSALEPAAPEGEPRPMTGFFSNLSPEGQAAALAYDGPEPNIGDTAPEGQQPVAWWVHDFHISRQPVRARGKFEGPSEYFYSADREEHARETARIMGATCTPLYTRPAEQAVTEAMVVAANMAFTEAVGSGRACTIGPAVIENVNFDIAMRAALKAAMEAGR